MNYDTSPISIKKRTQRSGKQAKSSTTSKDNISRTHNSKTNSFANTKDLEVQTPVRKSGQVSDSPQFLDFTESPEFRVGWDDGFGTTESACNKIKFDDTLTSNQKKPKRQVRVRTLRTQRILSKSCQSEIVNVNDHPDSDEFLQWAESLLCEKDSTKNENNGESFTLNSSNLNQSFSSSNGPQSPKVNVKTPKRPVSDSNPSSKSSKQTNIYKTIQRRSCTSDTNGNSMFGKLEDSPLVKHSNGEISSKTISNKRSQMKFTDNISTNNNQVTSKNDVNDYFNDSINELMIQCSQAVESKLNKENSDLNLLEDSSNDLILQCTQKVEEKLMEQNVIKNINSSIVRHSHQINGQHKSMQTNSNFQPSKTISENTSANKSFIPKQVTNLHKLDSPINFPFDNKGTNNLIFNINNQFITKDSNDDLWSSPDHKHVSNGSLEFRSKSSTKHFLSPTARDEACSRKRFCHSNDIVTSNTSTSNRNQDLKSILNEDEEVLSTLDIDEVLSQVPSTKPFTKPDVPFVSKYVPEVKTSSSTAPKEKSMRSSTNVIASNRFKPNLDNGVLNMCSKPILSEKNIPLTPVSDMIPKYTQEQIQLKKIEAKRRQALKLRKQKSFELK